MSDINKVYNENCLDTMSRMENGFIDLTVTSPPYDNLRTYNDSLEWTDKIWKQIIKGLYRVTKDGGVVVWVVGDATINGSETGTSFKQALYFKYVGFNLHDTMIYQKTGIAYPGNNRYNHQFEYMFVFSKGRPRVINLIKDNKNKYCGELKTSTFRKADGAIDSINKKIKISEYSVRGNVWEISAGYMKSTPDKIAYNHPAIFPDKLAHDHIISWSNKGDLVLDPMCGSGTTGVACIKTERNFIGIEKDKQYFDIATKRINEWQERYKQQELFDEN